MDHVHQPSGGDEVGIPPVSPTGEGNIDERSLADTITLALDDNRVYVVENTNFDDSFFDFIIQYGILKGIVAEEMRYKPALERARLFLERLRRSPPRHKILFIIILLQTGNRHAVNILGLSPQQLGYIMAVITTTDTWYQLIFSILCYVTYRGHLNNPLEFGRDDHETLLSPCLELPYLEGRPTLDIMSIDNPIPIQEGERHAGMSVTEDLKRCIRQLGHIPDRNVDHKIDFDENFVQLRLVGEHQINVYKGQVLPDKYQRFLEKHMGKEISIGELIKNCKPGSLILLQGRAGVGKSTLSQKLAWEWANGRWADGCKAVFVLRVRQLVVALRTKEPLSYIFKHSSIYRTENVDLTPEWIRDNEDDIICLLDGVDEYPDLRKDVSKFCGEVRQEGGGSGVTDNNCQHEGDCEHQDYSQLVAEPREWCCRILERSVLQRSTIFLLSRPFKELYNFKPQKVIEVVGLTKTTVMQYIDKNVKLEQQEKVKAILESNPVLLSVCTITFFARMICDILERNENVSLHGLTSYTRICSFIVQKCAMRSPDEETDELSDDAKQSLKQLADLAYNGLLVKDTNGLECLLFNDEDLRKVNFTESTLRRTKRTGLLQRMKSQIDDDEDNLAEFVHLSIQELLAMAKLVTSSPCHLKDVFSSMLKSSRLSMAQLYLCGLVSDKHFHINEAILAAVKPGFSHSHDLSESLFSAILETYTRTDRPTHARSDYRHMFANEESSHDRRTQLVDHLRIAQLVYETQTQEFATRVGRELFGATREMVIKGQLTAVDVEGIIYFLENNPDINKFRLISHGLDGGCEDRLAAFLKTNQSLKEFVISEHFSSNGFRKILDSVKQSNVQVFGFTPNTEDYRNKKHLAEFLRNTSTLSELNLAGKLSPKGIKAIAEAVCSCKNIRKMEIDDLSDLEKFQIIQILSCRPEPIYFGGITSVPRHTPSSVQEAVAHEFVLWVKSSYPGSVIQWFMQTPKPLSAPRLCSLALHVPPDIELQCFVINLPQMLPALLQAGVYRLGLYGGVFSIQGLWLKCSESGYRLVHNSDNSSMVIVDRDWRMIHLHLVPHRNLSLTEDDQEKYKSVNMTTIVITGKGRRDMEVTLLESQGGAGERTVNLNGIEHTYEMTICSRTLQDALLPMSTLPFSTSQRELSLLRINLREGLGSAAGMNGGLGPMGETGTAQHEKQTAGSSSYECEAQTPWSSLLSFLSSPTTAPAGVSELIFNLPDTVELLPLYDSYQREVPGGKHINLSFTKPKQDNMPDFRGDTRMSPSTHMVSEQLQWPSYTKQAHFQYGNSSIPVSHGYSRRYPPPSQARQWSRSISSSSSTSSFSSSSSSSSSTSYKRFKGSKWKYSYLLPWLCDHMDGFIEAYIYRITIYHGEVDGQELLEWWRTGWNPQAGWHMEDASWGVYVYNPEGRRLVISLCKTNIMLPSDDVEEKLRKALMQEVFLLHREFNDDEEDLDRPRWIYK